VVAYVDRSLRRKGYTTVKEPLILTDAGTRIPDLIGILGSKALVLDAQVVTDGRSLDDVHSLKVQKYSTISIIQEVKRMYNVSDVQVLSVTLNWRGIWSGASVNELLALGVIRTTDTALISTRVAVGGVHSFRVFNRYVGYRRGVG